MAGRRAKANVDADAELAAGSLTAVGLLHRVSQISI
jgi:hypothetical protein